MKSRIFSIGVLSLALLAAAAGGRAATTSAPAIAIAEPIHLPNQSIAPAHDVSLNLPALPSKPGKELVLRFRIVCQTRNASGCNYNAALAINGQPIGPATAAGESRLIGRESSFYLKDRQDAFQIFSGNNLMVMFAPTLQQADTMTTDGKGATYTLNISDLARGVDVNTLIIGNNLKKPPFPGSGNLLVEGIEVGWVDAKQLSQAAAEVPQRGAIARSISADGLRLLQATGGGFRIVDGKGVELAVETAVSMDPAADAALVAQDAVLKDIKLTIADLGPAGFSVNADWRGLRLSRSIQIKGGLVLWHDRWTNTASSISGIPFQYHFFLLHDKGAKFHVAGSDHITAVSGAAQNPTLFVGSASHPGMGVGITAESDWLRLLMEIRCRRGIGQIFTRTLALAPGTSIDFDLTLAPTAQGGYWNFINAQRERWGVNGRTMARPFFFSYAAAPGISDPVERARRSLGNLGPLTVAAGGWLGLESDAHAVAAGAFGEASLAPQSPEAAREVDRFLSFDHRKTAQEQFKSEVAAIHAACPEVKVVQKMHPAMEAVYRPLLERWPIAGEAILTAGGKPFEDTGYSRAWLRNYADHNWGVYYFVPRPGSIYLRELLRREAISMDDGGDGIYCDEFAWASNGRAYSRYDYSRWDGVSADLDAQGKVLRLKSDNGQVTESAQIQIANAALSRGKFFLGNGGPALRSTTSLPGHYFMEGGNGLSWFPRTHLTAAPLVFGNFGDSKSLAGIIAAVRQCLSVGTLYSPGAGIHLLLKGPDNFVSKLYPMTVMEIGPGWIRGKERLATIVSGHYQWPTPGARMRVYSYDAQGNRIENANSILLLTGSDLALQVPKNGLVIAEVVSQGP